MFIRELSFTLLLLLAACRPSEPEPAAAVAASGTEPADPTAPVGERLLAEAPDGWKQTFGLDRDDIRLAEFVPPDTPADGWTEKVSFESFGQAPLPDPIELVTGIAEDQADNCEGFADHNTFSGYENGYPTSVRLLICDRNILSGLGQTTLIKTILGAEQFYVVTRALRYPPEESAPEADVAEMSLYLRAISVCNGTEAHPCPSGGATS